MKKNLFKSIDLVKIFVFLAAVFLFWFKGKDWIDPDFGWHYRMGELILKSGIPKTDPFSYTMSSFPYIDHEWLTDVFLFKVNNLLGYSFLSLIFSIIATVSLVIITKGFKKQEKAGLFKLSFLFLSAGTLLPFLGIRPQVLSWLFLAFWLRLILDENVFKKYFFLLPFLMIIWANLHGSFAIGVFCLGLVVFLRFLRTRKLQWQGIIALILSTFATFCNPYGWHLWKEIWRTVSDPALRWRIIEWQPSLFSPVLTYFLIVSLGSLIFVFRKKLSLEKLGLYLFFLAQSFLGVRYVPLFLVVSVPLYFETIDVFYDKIILIKFGKERWQKAGIFMLTLGLLTAGVQSYFSLKEGKNLSEENYYPASAISYLRGQSLSGNLFSHYNWGGFLIWKFPEKKVYIDGRMPSWRRKENLPDESNNAMDDYLKMQTSEKDLKKGLEKYNITMILWPKENKQKGLEKLLGNFLLDKLIKLNKKSDFSITSYLEKNGWQKVYEDNLSQIYAKK